jgi:hypothetical protein
MKKYDNVKSKLAKGLIAPHPRYELILRGRFEAWADFDVSTSPAIFAKIN